jgi:DNA mismatch repair protein MutL
VTALPRAENLAVRIRDLFGNGLLARLAEIGEFEGDGFRLTGFLARSGQGRRDRLQQFVILNGRAVSCPPVHQSLREAYAGAIQRGEHPLCVLHVEMDLNLVDCNVHPTKREVRLRQPESMRRAVFDAARKVLAGPGERSRSIAKSAEPRQPFVPEAPQSTIPLHQPSFEPPGRAEDKARRVGRFRCLGLLGDGYLVLEGEEGLVLLDSRAASERILFELLMRQMASEEAQSQRLLIPAIVELPLREYAWVIEHLEELRAGGFCVEAFGGSTLKIEGVPASAAGKDPSQLLHEVASALRAAGRLARGREVREALARSVSRFAASGEIPFDQERAIRLVRELLRCELPYASPSGRPTMIQFSFSELDRKFGRVADKEFSRQLHRDLPWH